jgi:hypothetical protein
MAGFCELAIGLRAPKLAAAGAKSRIVSGRYLKYSRFRETATGDWFRSGLGGGRSRATDVEYLLYRAAEGRYPGFVPPDNQKKWPQCGLRIEAILFLDAKGRLWHPSLGDHISHVRAIRF